MNDYIQQLAEIKKSMKKPVVTNPWSDSEVYELLEKGETPLHSKHSCEVMLSLLKGNTSQRNTFCHVIHKWEQATGKKLQKPIMRRSSLPEDVQEKIKKHIVPIGYTMQYCANWLYRMGLTGKDLPRSAWQYETNYSKAQEEKAQEAVPTFAETVEKHEVKTSDLDINLQAIRALMGAGMSFQQIAKVTGKEENLVIALMKVCEAFN